MRDILALIRRKGAEGKLILYEHMEVIINRLITKQENLKEKDPRL